MLSFKEFMLSEGNMGYVRFENTYKDLKDCYDHLDDEVENTDNAGDEDGISISEDNYRRKLIELCKDIANER